MYDLGQEWHQRLGDVQERVGTKQVFKLEGDFSYHGEDEGLFV